MLLILNQRFRKQSTHSILNHFYLSTNEHSIVIWLIGFIGWKLWALLLPLFISWWRIFSLKRHFITSQCSCWIAAFWIVATTSSLDNHRRRIPHVAEDLFGIRILASPIFVVNVRTTRRIEFRLCMTELVVVDQ